MLFGISNVTQEFLVKKHTIVEFLALLGISGTIISGIQLYVCVCVCVFEDETLSL